MKKVVSLVLVVLVFSISTFGTRLVIRVSCSTVHHVYSGQSIQDAINSAQHGDTVFVHAGIYYEHVVVNKTVSLIGENKHTTIIDGGAVQYDVIYVTANKVTISSFTLQRGGRDGWPDRRGIYISYSNNNNISNNIIRNNAEGIFVCTSNNNIFVSNNVHANNINGIWLFNSSNNIIIGNNISDNGKSGMIFQSVCSNNLIFYNNFIENKHKNNLMATTRVCANNWNYNLPYGGNHWSDYNGVDEFGGPHQNENGSDGIGDTPYVIDENNQDNYPLMSPCSAKIPVEIPKIPEKEGPPPVKEEVPFWMQWWIWVIVAIVIVTLAVAVYFSKKRKPPIKSRISVNPDTIFLSIPPFSS